MLPLVYLLEETDNRHACVPCVSCDAMNVMAAHISLSLSLSLSHVLVCTYDLFLPAVY